MLLECAGSVHTCSCRVSQALKSLGHNSPIPGHFLVCARRVCRLTNDLRMRVRKAVSHWCTPAFHAVEEDEDEDDEDEDDDARIAKFVCVEFSYEALKVRRGPLGLCIGTYGPLECSGEFLKPS